MTKILLSAWALVMVQLSLWTYYAPSPTSSASESRLPATEIVERLRAKERYSLYGRDSSRKGTIESLSQPWATFCEPEGRRRLSGAVGGYFQHRYNEIRSALDTYGPDGGKFVSELYKTPADRQIERLTQEAYVNGYIKIEDYGPKSFERLMLIEILKNEKVRGKGCG